MRRDWKLWKSGVKNSLINVLHVQIIICGLITRKYFHMQAIYLDYVSGLVIKICSNVSITWGAYANLIDFNFTWFYYKHNFTLLILIYLKLSLKFEINLRN